MTSGMSHPTLSPSSTFPAVLIFQAVLVLVLLVSTGCSSEKEAASDAPIDVRAMTFNIRYANPGDGVDVWENRRDWVAALLDSSGADVIGLQEVLHHQLEDILLRTERFGWVGVGRDDGKRAGEYSPILYDSSRFALISSGTRWLSETPDSTGSRGWDAALPRIATFVTLRDRSNGRTWTVWNTHFDHRGEQARAKSAELIRTWMRDADLALGDFNVLPESDPWNRLVLGGLIDAGRMAGMDSVGTFRSFDPEAGISNRIDYVFLHPRHQLLDYRVLAPVRNGRYPSDHMPVVADVRIQPDNL